MPAIIPESLAPVDPFGNSHPAKRVAKGIFGLVLIAYGAYRVIVSSRSVS